jgi:hypothetical protein
VANKARLVVILATLVTVLERISFDARRSLIFLETTGHGAEDQMGVKRGERTELDEMQRRLDEPKMSRMPLTAHVAGEPPMVAGNGVLSTTKKKNINQAEYDPVIQKGSVEYTQYST